MQKLLFLVAAPSAFATILLMQGIPMNHTNGGTCSSSAGSGLTLTHRQMFTNSGAILLT